MTSEAGAGRRSCHTVSTCISNSIAITNLDHVGSHEADAAVPAFGRVVQDVVHAESVVFLDQLLQLLLEENVIWVDIGEDQIDLGGVVAAVAGTVADDRLDDLEHGGDTSATGDHTDVTAHVGGVDHGALGTAHLHGLTDLELGQVLGDVALGVGLDQQVKVASLVVGGDGGIGADHLLGLTGNGGGERDVLADGKTQDVGGAGQGETVDTNIVGDLVLLLEDEVLELGGVQDLARLCGWGLACGLCD